jgi:hypothetical protein
MLSPMPDPERRTGAHDRATLAAFLLRLRGIEERDPKIERAMDRPDLEATSVKVV